MKRLFLIPFFSVVTLAIAAQDSVKTYSPIQIREIFFLLGMHCEYFGKSAGSPDTFYTDERAAEAVYTEHADRLRASLGLKSVEDLWPVVDSFYRKTEEDLSLKRIYVISSDAFVGYGDDAALGYLSGAAVRHWKDGCYRFANATHKAQVIGHLLAWRDCGDVEVRTYVARIPNNSEVRFHPSKAISDLIEQSVLERSKKEPNKALVPTVMSVTPAADAPVAPATTAAHL
jgi:hypothetical protein